jgi:hypothetical protein
VCLLGRRCLRRAVVAVLVVVFTSTATSCLELAHGPAGRGTVNASTFPASVQLRKELRPDTAVSRLSLLPLDWPASFAWVPDVPEL